MLPGLGPTAAIAILFPLTTVLPPVPAIIMLAAIYYGAMYGGSTTAILLNIPGEVASVPDLSRTATRWPSRDGAGSPSASPPSAPSSRAPSASSPSRFFAPVARRPGAPLRPARVLRPHGARLHGRRLALRRSLVEGHRHGAARLPPLAGRAWGPPPPSRASPSASRPSTGGVDLIALIVGLFAISEVFLGIEESRVAIAEKIRNIFPSLRGPPAGLPAILRGTGIGFFLGLLPGCAPSVTVFMAYDAEKKLAEAARALRPGRHRGRGRARVGQQRDQLGRLHPADGARASPPRRRWPCCSAGSRSTA